MLTLKYRIIFFLIIFSALTINAQVVYIPIESGIYEYLSDLSNKGVIEFNDYIKPISRYDAAEKLEEISHKQQLLTQTQSDELKFYSKEFGLELSEIKRRRKTNLQHFHLLNELLFFRLSFLENTLRHKKYELSLHRKSSNSGYLSEQFLQYSFWFDLLNPFLSVPRQRKFSIIDYDEFQRPRMLSVKDSHFLLRVSPNLGYKEQNYDEYERVRWIGANVYAYLYDWLGVSLNFNYYDKHHNYGIFPFERLSPETGIVELDEEFGFEYSKIQTVITANWKWGSLSLGKDHVNIGHGRRGQLILSSKAPSFLFARLDLKFIDWFRFNFFQGWLSSEVVDSGKVFRTELESKLYREFRSKYIINKSFIFTPYKGVDVALGESVIFSDTYNVYYLLPFLIYKIANLENQRGKYNFGSNTFIYASISGRNIIPNTHLYGTIFIDQLSIYGIKDEDVVRDQFGFTLGFGIVDIPLDDLKFNLEYTRINPFVYEHYIQTQTYRSTNYLLGHWIGHNSDLFYTSLKHNIKRGLSAKLWYQKIRQGSSGNAELQYNTTAKSFLFGLKKNIDYLGFDIDYEILHDLFVEFNYTNLKFKEEIKLKSYKKSENQGVSFSLRYGLK